MAKFKNSFFINYDFIISASVFFFYISIVFYYIQPSMITLAVRYVTSIVCCLLPYLKKRFRISFPILFFIVICTVTGLLNWALIGNTTFPKLFYTLMSVPIARVLLDRSLNPKALLYGMYINAVYIAFRFFSGGINATIYANTSTNYVSILLIFPLVVYYCSLEERKHRISLIPALVVFILCLLAQGRGGILVAAIIFLTVFLFANFNNSGMKPGGKQLFFMLMVVFLIILVLMLVFVFNVFEKLEFLKRFNELGMDDHGRSEIWSSYTDTLNNNLKYILLGAPLKQIYYLSKYEWNLHNSYFNIHAFNGLIMVICFLIFLIYAGIYGFKNKRWIFLGCFVAVIIRGITDQVFWGTIGTPFLFFFMIAPFVKCSDNLDILEKIYRRKNGKTDYNRSRRLC